MTPLSRSSEILLPGARTGLGRWATPLFLCFELLLVELAIGAAFALIALTQAGATLMQDIEIMHLAAGGALLPLTYWMAGILPGFGIAPAERLRRRMITTALAFGLLIGWEWAVENNAAIALVLAVACLFLFGAAPVFHSAFAWALHRIGAWGKPVVVLGARETGRQLVERLRRDWHIGLVPVAFFDEQPERLPGAVEGLPVLGPLAAAGLVAGRIDTAVIALPCFGNRKLSDLVSMLPFPHVILLPELPEMQSLWVSGRDMGGVLALELDKGLLLQSNRQVKRAADILFSAFTLAIVTPLVAVASAAILLIDPGPILFSHPRRGQDGKIIRVLKLRTMYRDADQRLERHLAENPAAAEEWRRFYKLKRDPRVLPVVGELLRRFSIDELPQLWNVLRGDMSLVGPRPFPDYHLAAFDPKFRDFRQSVRPGLTGLWQVTIRSDGDLVAQRQLDTYYIRNWSIWLDLEILLRTWGVVLSARGAS